MTTALLTRRTHRRPTRPDLTVLGELTLPLARLHEICGPARHTLAMLIAAATRGPVFWITPAWTTDALNPDGMVALTQPNRFTFLALGEVIGSGKKGELTHDEIRRLMAGGTEMKDLAGELAAI